MAAASSTGSAASVQHTPLALKVPKTKSTGSAFADEENEARRQQFMCLIDNCVWAPRILGPMYGHMQKLLAETRAPDGGMAMFGKGVTSAKSVPADFWAAWITSCSEFSAADMVAIKKFDSEGPLNLGLFATQLSPTLRLPEHALYVEVFGSICNELHASHGKRLQGLRARIGFTVESGMINLAKEGAYRLHFKSDGTADKVRHCSGVEIALPAHAIVAREFHLSHNHLDFEAQVQLPPTAPLKLHTFFSGDRLTGPYAKVRYTGKSKLFGDVAKRHYDEVLGRQASVGHGNVAEQCKRDFAELDKEAKRQKMSAAQRAAAKTLASKRQRRELKLTVSNVSDHS